MELHSLPAPSVILEWENVRLGGRARVCAVLAKLSTQLHALAPRFEARPELLITYREADIARADLLALLHAAAPSGRWPCALRPLPIEAGVGYYEQKNLAVEASTNPVVLFLDSDVLPQAGWLLAMLSPFLQWSVSVLAGATTVEATTLYGRAIALAWLLPPPPPRIGVRPVQAYFANNLAFRRSLFLRFPFPSSGAYRGQCAAQLRQLEAAGIPVLEQTDALTLHPPPPGIAGFAERAWYAGTGAHLHTSSAEQGSLRAVLSAFQTDMQILRTRIRTRTPDLRASTLHRAAGWALGTLYFLIKAAGHLYSGLRHTPQRSALSSRSAPSATGPL